MRQRRRFLSYLLLLFLHIQLSLNEKLAANYTNKNDESNSKDPRGIFSPRMDYDQWKPLGRGDPLKNDPTYDYVPPVLDRVHYWVDPALRKPDPPAPGEGQQKTEILLLGVSSKKPSITADSRKDSYDSFLKFVDGPKFNPNNQRISRPYPLFSSYLPSSFYAKNKNKASNDQRMPYTMLMPPPPMFTKKPNSVSQKPMTLQQITTNSLQPSTTPATTTMSQVTIQPSKLVYQASSLGGLTGESSTNLTPVSFTTKNTPRPYNEDVVFQKHLKPPESYIQIQFTPYLSNNLTNKPLLALNSDHNINYVTPPPLHNKEIMHKGQVSDGNLDISNTYVKIGKTEAQMQPDMLVFSHVKHPLANSNSNNNNNKDITQTPPLTMQTIENMQTMQPPPVTESPVFTNDQISTNSINALLQALEKDEETASTDTITTTTTITTTSSTTAPTTTTTSLTTDPIFKHYKQPAEPLKGPLYLIIQGHSKVKTYGPSKQYHGIRVQDTNEIGEYEKEEVRVKDLHGGDYFRNERRGRSRNLETLKHVIQTGLGAIDFEKIPIERKDDEANFKEAEVEFGYKVGEDVTSEKYHKGIVEEARQLKV